MFRMKISNNNEPIYRLDAKLANIHTIINTSKNNNPPKSISVYKKIGILGRKILPMSTSLESLKDDSNVNYSSSSNTTILSKESHKEREKSMIETNEIIKKLLATNLEKFNKLYNPDYKSPNNISCSSAKSEFKTTDVSLSNSRLVAVGEDTGKENVETASNNDTREVVSRTSTNNSFKFDFTFFNTRKTTLRELHEKINSPNRLTSALTLANSSNHSNLNFLDPTKIIFQLSKIHSNNRKLNSTSSLITQKPRKSNDSDYQNVKTLTFVDFKDQNKLV